MDQGQKISFKLASARPGETATSKKRTGTDYIARKFITISVYDIQSVLFIHETVSRNLNRHIQIIEVRISDVLLCMAFDCGSS